MSASVRYWVECRHYGCYQLRMFNRRFRPDSFTLGMAALGAMLLVFPALRIAGLIALTAAGSYWLLMALLNSMRS